MKTFRLYGRMAAVLLLSFLLTFFSVGCTDTETASSSLPVSTPSPSPSPEPEQTFTGRLMLYEEGERMTLQTEEQETCTFSIKNVEITGLPGIQTGDRFTLWYRGTLDPEAEVQPVTVTRAEKIESAEDSIPLEWQDGGVFSDEYSKAFVALQSMSLEEKVGQVLLGSVPGENAASDAAAYHLGGYVTFTKEYQDKTRWQIQNMIQGWQSGAKIPLIVAVDEEGGDVVRISQNTNLRGTPFRSPQLLFAMGGMERIKSDAAEKASLLTELGVNVNLAPVADVSTSPEDFIYSRTLGQGPEETAEYVTTVLQQFQKKNLSAVLKHFPGYGSNSDTHTGASLDERTLLELENRDLIPFQAGIDAGVYAIMVSHNTVAAMDKTLPASLSPEVHRYLRETMGFTGVIMTDELSMDAISGEKLPLEKGVGIYTQALLAGNDLLLCNDYTAAYEEILQAVQNGIISEDLLNQAVFRILCWKCTLGLM